VQRVLRDEMRKLPEEEQEELMVQHMSSLLADLAQQQLDELTQEQRDEVAAARDELMEHFPWVAEMPEARRDMLIHRQLERTREAHAQIALMNEQQQNEACTRLEQMGGPFSSVRGMSAEQRALLILLAKQQQQPLVEVCAIVLLIRF
jgi:hypothetical protein